MQKFIFFLLWALIELCKDFFERKKKPCNDGVDVDVERETKD